MSSCAPSPLALTTLSASLHRRGCGWSTWKRATCSVRRVPSGSRPSRPRLSYRRWDRFSGQQVWWAAESTRTGRRTATWSPNKSGWCRGALRPDRKGDFWQAYRDTLYEEICAESSGARWSRLCQNKPPWLARPRCHKKSLFDGLLGRHAQVRLHTLCIWIHWQEAQTEVCAGRMAGYGPNWQQAHILGRQVALPGGMRDHIVPGLHPLLATLRVTHPDHPLLPALEAAEWLTEVFVQDMALKLQLHGRAWARLFPREVAAVTSHPGWPAFSQQVLAKDAFAKGVAGANRDFLGNPVKARHSAHGSCFAACLGTDKIVTTQGMAAVLLAYKETVTDGALAAQLAPVTSLLSKRQREVCMCCLLTCVNACVARLRTSGNRALRAGGGLLRAGRSEHRGAGDVALQGGGPAAREALGGRPEGAHEELHSLWAVQRWLAEGATGARRSRGRNCSHCRARTRATVHGCQGKPLSAADPGQLVP